ncbi:MAG: hypothetical protein WCE62_13630 [Polyangiales bacterium]
MTEDSALPIPDARLKVLSTSRPPEAVCLIERHGGILITGDSLQRTAAPDQYYSFLAKIMTKRMGFIEAV